jgi:Fe-coproporphyrin III synthase
MNRITQFVHGKGTVSELLRHRREPRQPVPSGLLAFTELRRPVVFWNMTGRCNLLCSHCYMEAGPEARREDELTTEEAKALIDDLAGLRVPLLLFSGGEPLVRDDFWDLARYAAEKDLTTALSTNGTLITPEVARNLKDVGVEYAGVSLDGASPETHDRMRGVPGSFERALRGLENCVAVGLKCGVRVTVTRENHTEISDLIDLALAAGVPRFCVYWLVPSGRGRELRAAGRLRPAEIREVLDLLYRRARSLDPGVMEFLTVDAPQDAVYLLSTLRREDAPAYASMCTLLEHSGVGCSAGDRVANIDPSGNVYPCQFAQLEELRIGNIRERRFGDLWNDPLNPVLSLFRTKNERVGGTCGGCSYREICGGGCRVRAFAEDGDLWAEDPLCPLCSGREEG